MAWKKKRDPLAPAEPAYHHPDRCMNCGHLKGDHNLELGCMTEGGTKYLEDEAGNGIRVCTCEMFAAAPETQEESK